MNERNEEGSRYILFEGQRLDSHSISRVFRSGMTLMAEIDGHIQMLNEYNSTLDAATGHRYLRRKLSRRTLWI